MRSIGLHLRVYDSLAHTAERAIALEMPIFQCFFIEQESREFISIDTNLIQQFQTWRTDHFKSVFIHGSYYINLANSKYDSVRLFKRELTMAQKLSCSHIILHPGSAARSKSREAGIDQLVHSLNSVMKQERDITIVLENTAHANRSIGSDLNDFAVIKEKLDYPERIKFCLDTAHAYSYGYDIACDTGRRSFMALLDKTIGIENIAVIHLNDTNQPCGSCIDKHAMIGEGLIGQKNLRNFVLDPRLADIPLILELPVLSELQEDAMLQKIRKWHT